jgi:hypothetical protein
MDNEQNLANPKYQKPFDIRTAIEDLPNQLEGFDTYISQFQQKIVNMINVACKQALESGQFGVRVTTKLSDGNIMVEVTDEVPFGEIHYVNETGPFAQFGPL